uniref:ATP synthase F0 subunit 8 n=1 Tax=Pholoe pallida TaxID=328599 RepID=A0A343W6K6_9ANNE|nr:ATP synthase F0 subunit 8 [Pholoe pallida]
MPHLSPLNWLVSPIIFWFILLTIMSSLWWTQTICFPKKSSPNQILTLRAWKW